MIVLIILCNVVFFSIVFIRLDTQTSKDAGKNAQAALKELLPLLACIAESRGVRGMCGEFSAPLVVNEATVMSVLFLLSVCSSSGPFLWL